MSECDNCVKINEVLHGLYQDNVRQRNTYRTESENFQRWARAWKAMAKEYRRILCAKAPQDDDQSLALDFGEVRPGGEKLGKAGIGSGEIDRGKP